MPMIRFQLIASTQKPVGHLPALLQRATILSRDEGGTIGAWLGSYEVQLLLISWRFDDTEPTDVLTIAGDPMRQIEVDVREDVGHYKVDVAPRATRMFVSQFCNVLDVVALRFGLAPAPRPALTRREREVSAGSLDNAVPSLRVHGSAPPLVISERETWSAVRQIFRAGGPLAPEASWVRNQSDEYVAGLRIALLRKIELILSSAGSEGLAGSGSADIVALAAIARGERAVERLISGMESLDTMGITEREFEVAERAYLALNL